MGSTTNIHHLQELGARRPSSSAWLAPRGRSCRRRGSTFRARPVTQTSAFRGSLTVILSCTRRRHGRSAHPCDRQSSPAVGRNVCSIGACGSARRGRAFAVANRRRGPSAATHHPVGRRARAVAALAAPAPSTPSPTHRTWQSTLLPAATSSAVTLSAVDCCGVEPVDALGPMNSARDRVQLAPRPLGSRPCLQIGRP